MGLINKGGYGMFFVCGIWCLADVSSVLSPSSEQKCSDKGLMLSQILITRPIQLHFSLTSKY